MRRTFSFFKIIASQKSLELTNTQRLFLKECHPYGLRKVHLHSVEFKKIEELIIQGIGYYDNFVPLITNTLRVLLSDKRAPLTALQAFSLITQYRHDDPALHVLKETYPRRMQRTVCFNGNTEYKKIVSALISDKKNPLTVAQAFDEMNGLSINECKLLVKIRRHGGCKDHVRYLSAQHPNKYLHRIAGHFPAVYFEEHEKRVEKFIELIQSGVNPDKAIREVDEFSKTPMATLFESRDNAKDRAHYNPLHACQEGANPH